ncbi:ZIP Zinc transporter [Plasmodiophora brassicae]|uniref:Zinc transporter ZIP11 n=1 Tax=Plasmodiophora brassicae TaxID=37360 RepID=A0A3P3Y2U9_PLABS|nr:unnamed protein product [Plasmodiophora brassicae]
MNDVGIVGALYGTLLTWGLTAVGAAGILVIPASTSPARQRCILDASFGFAAGIMTAASFWSLLHPAMELAQATGAFVSCPYVPVSIGFILGAAFVHLADWALKEYRFDGMAPSSSSSPDDDKIAKAKSQTQWRRTVLIVIAITAHNIPEGLAVGVAFATMPLGRARSLAIAIGLQNMPEGLAVSLPLYRAGASAWKAFFIGQLSGMVEPVGGFLGAYAVTLFEPMLPWAMAFAAGAMIFVVFDDIVPECSAEGNTRLASWFGIGGFVLMTVMDVMF